MTYNEAARTGPAVWSWSKWATCPKSLRRATILTMSLTLLLLSCLYLLGHEKIQLALQLDAALLQQKLAREQLALSGQEKAAVTQYLPTLEALVDRGVFGEEKRLEWVESLKMIEQKWPGIAIAYSITPQKMLSLPNSGLSPPPKTSVNSLPVLAEKNPADQSVGIFATQMQLTLSIQHEADVLAIMSELARLPLGAMRLDRCSFTRGRNDQGSAPVQNTSYPMNAQCQVTWTHLNLY